MGAYNAWGAADIEVAKALLASCRPGEISEWVLPELTRRIGRQVTLDALGALFRRLKIPPPVSFCRGGHRPDEYRADIAQAYTPNVSELDYEDEVTLPRVAAPPPAPAPSRPSVEVPRQAEDILKESAADRERRRIKAEHKTLVEQLEEANARADFFEAIKAQVEPTIQAREHGSGIREGALVALASDWHVEEIVTRDATAGRNEYNPEIAEQRARRYFSGVRWLLNYHRQSFAMRDMVLWLGGDLISGFIHPELAETSELTPVEAVLFVKRMLNDGIATLLADEQLERITVPTNYGNHGRTTEKRRVKNGAEMSYEWLLYNVLRDEWKHEPRIEFIINRSAHTYLDVYGFTTHWHHGDEVRYWGGVGGLSVPLGKRVPAWDTIRKADYHHIGHFHQMRDFRSVLTNGSMIGLSEYAVSVGAQYEAPEQASYVLDSKRGKCLVTPIWLDEE